MNTYPKQKERGLKRKINLIMERGGKCEKCGYDKNISSLDFHHVNPEIKGFPLNMRQISARPMSEIKKEADKCILVCANCHREIHYPYFSKENISELIEEYEKNAKNELKERQYKYKCPVCGSIFKAVSKKKYCCKECRDKDEGRDKYPTKEEVNDKYFELKSWEKVAQFYGLTRRIIQRIRKK